MSSADNPPSFPVIATGLHTSMPDLARIPKERWKEALAPFSSIARDSAVRALPDPKERFDAMLIAGDCAREDAETRARMGQATSHVRVPAPAPEARPGPRRSRQVNVRLYPRDFARLAAAAAVLGATPTELARILIVRGTARVLEEATQRGKP